MINIIDETFEWIDIKILTAKSQLSLDSLSELFSLYDYCTVNDIICYNEAILNQTSQQRLDKPFNQLKRKEQTDIIYNIGQQFFAGKLSFTQRIQKFQANLIDPNKISAFIQSIKEQVYIDLNCDQQRVQIVPSGWIQYPTELLLFQYYGICLQTKQTIIVPSHEASEIEFIDPQHIIFEKLNIGYLQGQNQKRISTFNGLFKDFVKNATLQRSILYYYKKLKLTSRKSSFEVGSEPNATNNLELIQLNTSLRFLHLVNLVDLEHEKGSLFASALSYVKPENFVPFFIYLKLIESPLKNILFEQFYGYSTEKDEEIQSNLKEKFNVTDQTYIDQLNEISQEKDTRIILLLRFFILNSKSKIHKFNQFSDLVSKISINFAEVYEAILFSLYLDLNQKNTIKYFITLGTENPFIRQFNYDETFYLFLSKKISKQQFPNVQQYIECWTDFVRMFEYIHQKKGQRYDELARANEYFQQLIK
ncbi:hypothetical protein FGO68_gene7571 [Halteria grandinella]|uniref:Uncharacterized protein n=1 Tax=Halteria grandinella TaxID=5974 RepID=A0A8J8NH29_HALGN|nr:hypothetical protein FGO68_gene7571 [Halteria grandinella]